MKTSPAFKILSGVVLAAVVLYFGIQIYRYYTNPFSTTLTYQASAEDSIPMTGWLVREEETFHSNAATVTHSLREGEKVGHNQTIAMAYDNEKALETVTEINNLELQLQQLEFALTSYLDADAALRLDSSITGHILTLRQTLSGGDYSVADVSALKAAVLKSSHSYESAEDIQANITSVKEQIASLRSSLTGATPIAAPRSGTYSSVCDGYEGVLTVDFLTGLTPSALDHVAAGGNNGNVGKLIYGSTWYYAAAIDAKTAEGLKEGQTATLRLAKGLTQDAPVRVVSLSREEDGRVAVVLSCEEYLAQTTQLRHQAAELILDSYNGLRIPTTALRLDADGQTGVYCVVGVSAKFKPVTVVYQGDGYTLVQAAREAAGSAILRSGDEVIVTAKALENGMVVR
jgi:hypothetical protein